MSVKIMARVWELDLAHNEKLVLLALADHADDDGYCFPSIKRVAWKTNYSARAVQKILRRLEARGLVSVHKEATGKPGRARVYRLKPEIGPYLPPFETGEHYSPLDSEGVNDATETGEQNDARGEQKSATGEPASSPEPSLEPSLNHQETSSALPQLQNRKAPDDLPLPVVKHNGKWVYVDEVAS